MIPSHRRTSRRMSLPVLQDLYARTRKRNLSGRKKSNAAQAQMLPQTPIEIRDHMEQVYHQQISYFVEHI